MRRIVLGQRNPGEYGFWVSRPGFDAVSSTDDDDFLVSPDKVNTALFSAGTVSSGTYGGTAGSTYWYYANINHNLGYAPIAFVTGTDGNGNGLGLVSYANYIQVIGGTSNFLAGRYSIFTQALRGVFTASDSP